MSGALTIRLAKHADGGATLTCVRADGSSTWQRQRGAQAAYFPRHDLTHVAVESALGHRRGFYGLVADGWDMTDFGAPWPRGPLPADMDPSELIVGLLDAERAAAAAGGAPWTAADFTEQAAAYYAANDLAAAPPALTDAQLADVRARMADLFARWDAVAPGGALEIAFEVAVEVAFDPER